MRTWCSFHHKQSNVRKTLPSEFCCVLLELLLEKTGGVMGACWGCVVNNRRGLLPRLVAPPVRRGDNTGLVGYQTTCQSKFERHIIQGYITRYKIVSPLKHHFQFASYRGQIGFKFHVKSFLCTFHGNKKDVPKLFLLQLFPWKSGLQIQVHN